MMWRYWNGNGYWGSGGLGFGMLVAMAVWWALLIAAAVLFIRWLSHRAGRGAGLRGAHAGAYPEGEDPLEIARRRYAKGEITREQFQEIKETLLH
jgi:putative membrane protein